MFESFIIATGFVSLLYLCAFLLDEVEKLLFHRHEKELIEKILSIKQHEKREE